MQHKTQADGAWVKHDLIFQLANIGSEVIRAINWQKKETKNIRNWRLNELSNFLI